MCTITLEYNQNNALARRKLAALLATGLFVQKEVKSDDLTPYEPTQEELEAHRELRDAVLEHSRKSMSHIIARYLWSIISETTTATKTSSVGTYPIKVEKGTVTNEQVNYVDGTLTIEKAPLTVGVLDVTITEGEAIPSFTLTYSGFKNNDTEANAFTTKPKATTTATEKSKPGTYPITVSGGKSKNYALNYMQGTLTILPATGIESVYADGQENGAIYNINGQKLSKPQKGINIINGKKVVVK